VRQKLLLLPWLVFCHYEGSITEPLILLIVQVLGLKLLFLPTIYPVLFIIFKGMVDIDGLIHIKI